MNNFIKHIASARLVCAIMLVLTTLMSTAQSVTLRCEPYVEQGRNFAVTIRVQDIDARVTTAPEIKNCQLLYGPGISSYQSTSIVNGRATSTYVIDYTFMYRALTPGKVTVPAVSLRAGSQTYSSNSKQIEILPGNTSASQQPQGGYGSPVQPQQNANGTGPAISPKDLIVTVTMSKNNLYEHEAVIATIKVYTKHNITSFRATTLPVFEGFISEELPVNDPVKIENFRGENYYSAVLKRCLLYPQKDGKLTINSGRYDVTLETYEIITQGYMRTHRPVKRNITTTSNQLTVNVKPLPAGAPAGFQNAVGNYTVNTSLLPKQLRTNEAATYTLEISGTGNLKQLLTPELTFPADVETFNPETDVDATFNGNDMKGTFKATYTFVPHKTGELEFPGWQFVYFNPAQGKYVTIDVPAITRQAIPGTPVHSQAQKDVDKIDDILHIHPLDSSKLSAEPKYIFSSGIYLLAYIIIILGLIIAAIVYRRQIKLNADVRSRKKSRARSVATKRLKAAREAMQAGNYDAFYQQLAKALWGYLSDKLLIPASALKRDNVQQALETHGATPQEISETLNVLDQCEMARFTPDHSATEVEDLYNRAATAIDALQGVQRRQNSAAKDATPKSSPSDSEVTELLHTPFENEQGAETHSQPSQNNDNETPKA